ncbi:hypothetical protein BMS3Abin17_00224 [archaeon BMS3Abin17]|nr:hypothetical protein BMS3Abin17_00224 [archaeon BMS3Abin17]HDZ60792.1 hypothetical protein [Candidatus Pacearchaeota archaeon]
MEKKGLSTIVTTLLIILLVLVAAGMVWSVVKNIISEGAEGISLGRTTLGLEIISLEIKDSSIDVRIKRNIGEGDLIGVRFSLKDNESSEIIEKPTTMQELEERTFTLRQAEFSLVNLRNLTEISIAPILGTGSGKQTIGDLVVFYEVSGSEFVGGEDIVESECNSSDDCGINDWDGLSYCGVGGNVWRNFTEYACEINICIKDITAIETELCDSDGCNGGECVNESLGCITNDSCGIDGFIDTPVCVGNESWQNYTIYSCNTGVCSNSTSFILKENCSVAVPPEMCGVDAKCVAYSECSEHSDCDGRCGSTYCMCNSNSECIAEFKANTGVVDNIWPLGIGEFFDSADLPGPDSRYQFYYVGFPGSIETRCIEIGEYVSPSEDSDIYIRFSVSWSNITAGNDYEIWETFYNCNKSIS